MGFKNNNLVLYLHADSPCLNIHHPLAEAGGCAQPSSGKDALMTSPPLLRGHSSGDCTSPLLPTATNPRSATTPGGTRSRDPRTNAGAPRGSRDTTALGLRGPRGSPSSAPRWPGNRAANQSAAEPRGAGFRARGPPLFVAAANGRVRNIGGCPGDSVICHRITFENGTWNEGTAAAAAAAPAAPAAPGPAAAAAAFASPAPRRGAAAMRRSVPR